MVFSAAQLVRRHGVAATGMRDVAAHAEAPRGSLQHYFPGGKDQLMAEAAEWAGRYAAKRIARFVAALPEPTPGALFAAIVDQWRDDLRSNGFDTGCPVAASVADCASDNPTVRRGAAEAFAGWSAAAAGALRDMGVPYKRAEALATLMISTLEGAILMARAERDLRPLEIAARELRPLLDGAVASPAGKLGDHRV
jgi:AcrR family transcriptional regulator